MRNKFAASCAKCRRVVLAGEGETNMEGGRWVTVHANCPTHAQYRYSSPLDGLTGRDYDDEHYSLYGMTQADFRDAVNPNEGDR